VLSESRRFRSLAEAPWVPMKATEIVSVQGFPGDDSTGTAKTALRALWLKHVASAASRCPADVSGGNRTLLSLLPRWYRSTAHRPLPAKTNHAAPYANERFPPTSKFGGSINFLTRTATIRWPLRFRAIPLMGNRSKEP
jgi:hypothetical protein